LNSRTWWRFNARMTPIRASSAGGSSAQPDRSSTHFVGLIASAADHLAA
jgi:hypothetical protein